MGQAVGTTAAMALANHCSVQEVDRSAVVKAVAAQGINRIGQAAA
jgi:hypothetical protein